MRWLLALLLFVVALKSTAVSDSKPTQDRVCLAEVIYRESRGEPYKGQLAVGQVVLNRIAYKEFPDNICHVIFQKGQFPWTNQFQGFKAPKEYFKIAETVLSGNHELRHFRATHFHATYVNPNWKNLVKVAQIGNHIFYRL